MINCATKMFTSLEASIYWNSIIFPFWFKTCLFGGLLWKERNVYFHPFNDINLTLIQISCQVCTKTTFRHDTGGNVLFKHLRRQKSSHQSASEMGWSRAGGEKKLMEATNMFQLPSTRRRKRSNLSAASLHIKLHFFSNTPVFFPLQAWNKQTQENTCAPKWSTNPKPVSLLCLGLKTVTYPQLLYYPNPLKLR